jgi:hypothetical protein
MLAEDRPDDLAEALDDARARGPRWRERLERSLEHRMSPTCWSDYQRDALVHGSRSAHDRRFEAGITRCGR